MKYELTLSENDYLTFQLFEASTNALKIRNRRKSYFYLLVIPAGILIYGYLDKSAFLTYYGITVLVVSLIFGNYYLKWTHKRHYAKHVKDTWKNAFNEKVEVEISETQIKTADKTGESIINISEIVVANEISTHFLLKISTGPTLIVPKKNTSLTDAIRAMIDKHNISHVKRLDWKW